MGEYKITTTSKDVVDIQKQKRRYKIIFNDGSFEYRKTLKIHKKQPTPKPTNIKQ